MIVCVCVRVYARACVCIVCMWVCQREGRSQLQQDKHIFCQCSRWASTSSQAIAYLLEFSFHHVFLFCLNLLKWLLCWHVLFKMSSFSYISPFFTIFFCSLSCLLKRCYHFKTLLSDLDILTCNWEQKMFVTHRHGRSLPLFLLSVSHTRLFLTSFMYVDLA